MRDHASCRAPLVINIPHREYTYLHMVKEEDIEEGKLPRIALIAAKVVPEIPECISHLAEVFNQERANRLPLHTKFDFEFKLTVDLIKINSPLYPLTLPEEAALDAWIDELEPKGWIVKETSPVCAPLLFVEKSDGTLRPCVDYGLLNNVTVPDPYPTPLEPQIARYVEHAKVFSKLDCMNAFNQVRIKEGQEWLTAFRCRRGVYQFRVMPFGLKNAPACFQRLIDEALGDLLGTCAVAYADDILVFSPDEDSHRQHLALVLERMLKFNLTIKLSKCAFFQKSVSFLGNIILKDGHAIAPEKEAAIRDWQKPTTVSELRSFIGTCTFLKKFTPRLSELAAPLYAAACAKVLKWTPQCDQAFEAVKNLFLCAPILRHADGNKPFILACDSSNFAIAGVLLQADDDDVEHPVGYFSRKLQSEELNAMIFDKELMAVVESIAHWRYHLQGARHEFKVRTDHKALLYYRAPRLLSPKQARWAAELAKFRFKYEFVKGKDNHLPDALSRNPAFHPTKDEVEMCNTRTLIPDGMVISPPVAKAKPAQGPTLAAMTQVDQDTPTLAQQIRTAQPLAEDYEHIKKLALSSGEEPHRGYAENAGILYHQGVWWVPPGPLREQVIAECHDSLAAGHPGKNKTLELIRRSYSWKGITTDVAAYTKACLTCNRAKPSRLAKAGLLVPPQEAEGPWSSISVDFIVELPESQGYNAIMVVVDRFTKFSHFIPCDTHVTGPETVQLFIDNVFSLHGLPKEIISDRGPQFTSKFYDGLLRNLGIQPCRSTAYHPQSDGQTERTNQTLETYLRCYTSANHDDWKELLPLAQFAYNNSSHSSTGVSPFYATYGYNPSFTISPRPAAMAQAANERAAHIKKVQAELKLTLASAVRTYKEHADKKRRVGPTYQKGDLVMLDARNIRLKVPCRKLGPKRIGPYRILKKVGQAAYSLDLPATIPIYPVFHESLLTPYKGPVPESPQGISVDGDVEYEVEAIVSSKFHKRQLKYLVAWKGYTEADYTWVSAKDCSNSQELIKAYHSKFPNAAGPLPSPNPAQHSLNAMKLPIPHKNYSLASAPAGGIPPFKEQRVMLETRLSLEELTAQSARKGRDVCQQNPFKITRT